MSGVLFLQNLWVKAVSSVKDVPDLIRASYGIAYHIYSCMPCDRKTDGRTHILVAHLATLRYSTGVDATTSRFLVNTCKRIGVSRRAFEYSSVFQ
jgi:hypothetical protein